MNILVIGSGGREHALAHKLADAPSVARVFIAPGNGGTAAQNSKITNVQIDAGAFDELVDFSKNNNIGLVVVGPEKPLVDGIAAPFKRCGIPLFGPSAEAAKLEGSKAFSKDFMKRHRIPTASYATFTQYEAACEYIRQQTNLVVLKASGLAAGKGVLLPQTTEEALAGIKSIMVDHEFGNAGDEVVIEEYLEGEEVSIFALTDGYSFATFPPAQDHKRIFDGDKGPNTGGMGAYAPAPVVTKALLAQIHAEVVKPTIDGMRADGTPYRGLLYAGLMITKNGPKVLEYNCRFGDPETQAVIPLLSDDCDLAKIFLACAEGYLDSVPVTFKDACAATVVAASGGYPGSFAKGKVISFGNSASIPGCTVYHAGTTVNKNSQEIITSGGRVLAITGIAPTIEKAVETAYAGIKQISFEGMYYRKDIAYKALSSFRQAQSVTYADAGVNIDVGNRFVDIIKPLAASTRRPGADASLGGFGGVFDLKAVNCKDPILVSGTDGVGTKLRVAQLANYHDTVGIDLVAMSVNDVLVQGAEPLFFLDYYATSHLKLDIAAAVVKGVAQGCVESGCALIGGETAEMPGMYMDDDYDLAGFAVGVVERDSILPRVVEAGDVILGLPSSGPHSNGFSLIRLLVSKSGVGYDAPCPFPSDVDTLGKALLTPTKLYVKSCLPLIKENLLEALAHITGGGLLENIPRILPKGVAAVLDAKSWPFLPVFKWLAKLGNMTTHEISKTFNCGIGMVVVVKPKNLPRVLELLKSLNEPIYQIGTVQPVKPDNQQVIIHNDADTWIQ